WLRGRTKSVKHVPGLFCKRCARFVPEGSPARKRWVYVNKSGEPRLGLAWLLKPYPGLTPWATFATRLRRCEWFAERISSPIKLSDNSKPVRRPITSFSVHGACIFSHQAPGAARVSVREDGRWSRADPLLGRVYRARCDSCIPHGSRLGGPPA